MIRHKFANLKHKHYIFRVKLKTFRSVRRIRFFFLVDLDVESVCWDGTIAVLFMSGAFRQVGSYRQGPEMWQTGKDKLRCTV